MCTEDDDAVEAYNRHVDRLPGVDITDDYVSEKREVEAHGKRLRTTERMAEAALRGKMPKYDHGREKGAGGGGCCSRSVRRSCVQVIPARLGHAGVRSSPTAAAAI